jgi:hypothetical protein
MQMHQRNICKKKIMKYVTCYSSFEKGGITLHYFSGKGRKQEGTGEKNTVHMIAERR